MKAHSTAKPEHSHHHASSDRGGHGHGQQATAVPDSRQEMEQQQGLLSLMAGSPKLQRKCACGAPSAAGGSCSACAAKSAAAGSQVLQKKLAIGATDDPLEREADRVADQVMAAPAHSAIGGSPPRIQRFTGQGGGHMDRAPASVERVLASSGSPLEPGLRKDMEQRFGHDFSKVKVHSDATAGRSAQEVNAHAYTVGQDVVFGSGWFSPGTRDGQRLIAHELTHVIQQAGSSARLQREEAIPKAANADEAIGPIESFSINQLANISSNSSPLLEPLFKGGMIGFYAELRQAVRNGKGTELWERFKALVKSKSDVLALYKGYLWGVLQGLWSPIQGFIDLFKFGLVIQQWQFEFMRNIVGNLEELTVMKGTLAERFSKIGAKIAAFFQEKKTNVAQFLHDLVSAAQGGVFELAKQGGHLAGQGLLRFSSKPWGEIGEGVGVVIGSVLIEVLMAAFSEGIANVVARIGKVLGRVAPTLMKGVKFIASEIRLVVAELHLLFASLKQGLAKTGGSLLRGMEGLAAELGGLFDDVVAFLKKLLGGAEEAIAKLPKDLPVPVKAPAPHIAAPHSPPAVRSPHVEGIPAKKLPTEPVAPKHTNIELGTPSKSQVELTHLNEHSIVKSPSDAVKIVEQNPHLVEGKQPGHRSARVGVDEHGVEHHIVEVQDPKRPSGIRCEFHSDPIEIECPKTMGHQYPGKKREPFANDPEFDEHVRNRDQVPGVENPSVDESPSDLKNLEQKRGSTPQKVLHSADLGVAEGRLAAERDGLVWVFDNPRGIEHNVPGIDSVFLDPKTNEYWIVEFKGASAELSGDQMTKPWVRRKIGELEASNATKDLELVKKLGEEFRKGRLNGRTYKTPLDPVTGELGMTTRIGHDGRY